ncbi:hypothetical protein FRC03_009953 [Tulasnella sp. 419]|nr:hypothetical protein FRC03_009953 [Tulasnella sp. 419]
MMSEIENYKLEYTPLDDIAKIREKLREGFSSGKLRPIEYRKQQLAQLMYMLKDNAELYAQAYKKDLGRHSFETNMLELSATISEAVEAYNNVEKWSKPTVPPWTIQFSAMKPKVFKEAKGVGLIIGPFNFPVFCTLGPLVGAIAAGCACAVKLSEMTPHISALTTQLASKYLDTDVYEIINGGIPETTKVLELQWDHIVFTGSGTVGKVVAAAAAKHLTPITLELGGQCPVFLDPRINLKTAAKRILWGRIVNTGQTCVSPNHLFVPSSGQDALVDALKEAYAEFYPDGPENSESLGRIVNVAHFNRLRGVVEATKGAIVDVFDTSKSAIGDGKQKALNLMNQEDRFVPPMIVRDVNMEDPLMQQEIFGPILPIIPVKDFDEAISFTNSREHPLVLYIFSDDPKLKDHIRINTQSGAVDYNEIGFHTAVPGLPFGGVGGSGYGAHTSKFSFDTFTHLRSSVDSPGWVDLFFSFRFPPYTPSKIRQAGMLWPKLPPRPGAQGSLFGGLAKWYRWSFLFALIGLMLNYGPSPKLLLR